MTSETQEHSPSAGPQSNNSAMQEHFVTLQDGQPQLTSYTAEPIRHNATLKYGIKSGKFLDKGHASNMSECIRACGREDTCSLAFMLGRQCFSVACHSDAMCQTKPAFSEFYKPQLAFVKHHKVSSKGVASCLLPYITPNSLSTLPPFFVLLAFCTPSVFFSSPSVTLSPPLSRLIFVYT